MFLFGLLLFSCQSKIDKKDKFLGTWQMEEKLHPVRYYVYNYTIKENGDGYKLDVFIECHNCDTIKPSNYTFNCSYNEEKDVFEVQRGVFPETLMIDAETGKMNSNMKTKFPFIKKIMVK
jgi:hypothetical protein